MAHPTFAMPEVKHPKRDYVQWGWLGGGANIFLNGTSMFSATTNVHYFINIVPPFSKYWICH